LLQSYCFSVAIHFVSRIPNISLKKPLERAMPHSEGFCQFLLFPRDFKAISERRMLNATAEEILQTNEQLILGDSNAAGKVETPSASE
jgi:hypothetical protein